MENNYFTDDLKANIGNITEVEYLNYKFDDYKVVTFESEKKSSAYGSEFIRGTKAFRRSELIGVMNDSNLLFSLINLMKEPIPKGFHSPYLEEAIKTEKIIQFCHKYGLPYIDKYFEENYFEGDQNKYSGFNIQAFRRQVAFLFSYFKFWEAITKKDIKNLYEYGFTSFLLKGDLDKLITPEEKLAKAKENLAIAINANYLRTEINIFYNKDTDEFLLRPCSNSLISIAYYQLACFICTPEWARVGIREGKTNIKICKNCLEYFLGHGNSGYCDKPECDRRKVHRRNKNR